MRRSVRQTFETRRPVFLAGNSLYECVAAVRNRFDSDRILRPMKSQYYVKPCVINDGTCGVIIIMTIICQRGSTVRDPTSTLCVNRRRGNRVDCTRGPGRSDLLMRPVCRRSDGRSRDSAAAVRRPSHALLVYYSNLLREIVNLTFVRFNTFYLFIYLFACPSRRS